MTERGSWPEPSATELPSAPPARRGYRPEPSATELPPAPPARRGTLPEPPAEPVQAVWAGPFPTTLNGRALQPGDTVTITRGQETSWLQPVPVMKPARSR